MKQADKIFHLAEDGYPEECEKARQDATREMTEFFEEWCANE